MQADELVEEVRRLTRDTEPDYIFSDMAIYAAIADAQDEVMQRTHMVVDTWAYLLPAGDDVVVLPDFITSPKRVQVAGEDWPVVSTRPVVKAVVAYHEFGALYLPKSFDQDETLEVLAYVTARQRPDEDHLALEIPDRFHYNLAVGAAVKLLNTLDSDTQDPTRQQNLERQWSLALNDMYAWAARHNRKPKTAKYGGIT